MRPHAPGGHSRIGLEIFPGCGHAVHLEDHERYRDVLLRFLDRVDAPKGLNVRTTTRR